MADLFLIGSLGQTQLARSLLGSVGMAKRDTRVTLHSLDRKFDAFAERLPRVEDDIGLLKAAFHGLDRRVTRLEDAPKS